MTTNTVEPLPVQPELQLLYASKIYIDPPMELGPAAYGERRIINITGGEFSGPRISGTVLPGGADWQLTRRDGVTELEARYTLKTHDGELIYIRNWGLRHGPDEVISRLITGGYVDPSEYYFRTTPVYETGSDNYQWLTRTLAIGVGHRTANEVQVTVYQVL